MVAITVQDHPAESRYELLVDGELGGILEYTRPESGPVELRHTVVLPAFRGQGLAARLVAGAFEELRRSGELATASCGYVQSWLPEHPEVDDLLAR